MGGDDGWVVEGCEAAVDELEEGDGADEFAEGLDDADGLGSGSCGVAGAMGEEHVVLSIDDVDECAWEVRRRICRSCGIVDVGSQGGSSGSGGYWEPCCVGREGLLFVRLVLSSRHSHIDNNTDRYIMPADADLHWPMLAEHK